MNAREAMMAFRAAMLRWVPYIKRCTHSNDVAVQLKDRDVVVSLTLGTVQYVHTFTVQDVYGYVGTRQLRPHQKICKFVDQVILGALQAYKDRNSP